MESRIRRNVRRRSWFRFSLRTLLVAMIVSGALLGWLTSEIRRAKQQRELVTLVRARGGRAVYHFQVAGGATNRWRPVRDRLPAAVREFLTDDFFLSVHTVDAFGCGLTDHDMKLFSGLTTIRVLNLGNNELTDRGMSCLRRLRDVRELRLSYTAVSDEGLASVTGMRRLERLDANSTGLTDAGLRHVGRLTGLTSLDLGGTRVTDVGVESLATLTSLTRLDLGHTRITDAAASSLSELTDLQSLNLHGSSLTDAAVSELSEIGELTWLNVSDTWITSRGTEHLSAAMAGCDVVRRTPPEPVVNSAPESAAIPSE